MSGRTIHLVEEASPQSCGTTLALLGHVREQVAQAVGQRSAVVLLGSPALGARASASGLKEEVTRVGTPYGRALCGLPGLRRALRQVGRAERLVCWSPGTLAAARLLRPRVARTLVLTQPLDASVVRLARWGLRGRAATRVLAMGETLAAVAAKQLRGDVTALPLLVPRVEPVVEVVGASRGELRQRWRMTDERVKVVALLADPPMAADAQAAALTLGLARAGLVDEGWPGDVALLMHPDQWRRLRAQRMLEQLGDLYPLVLESRLATPWRVFAGCDMALVMGTAGTGGLSVGMAMAAGLPTVAAPSQRVNEWLEPGRTSLLAADGAVRSLAHQVTALLRDPDLAGRLGVAARHAVGRQTGQAVLEQWMQALEPGEASVAALMSTQRQADEVEDSKAFDVLKRSRPASVGAHEG